MLDNIGKLGALGALGAAKNAYTTAPTVIGTILSESLTSSMENWVDMTGGATTWSIGVKGLSGSGAKNTTTAQTVRYKDRFCGFSDLNISFSVEVPTVRSSGYGNFIGLSIGKMVVGILAEGTVANCKLYVASINFGAANTFNTNYGASVYGFTSLQNNDVINFTVKKRGRSVYYVDAVNARTSETIYSMAENVKNITEQSPCDIEIFRYFGDCCIRNVAISTTQMDTVDTLIVGDSIATGGGVERSEMRFGDLIGATTFAAAGMTIANIIGYSTFRSKIISATNVIYEAWANNPSDTANVITYIDAQLALGRKVYLLSPTPCGTTSTNTTLLASYNTVKNNYVGNSNVVPVNIWDFLNGNVDGTYSNAVGLTKYYTEDTTHPNMYAHIGIARRIRQAMGLSYYDIIYDFGLTSNTSDANWTVAASDNNSTAYKVFDRLARYGDTAWNSATTNSSWAGGVVSYSTPKTITLTKASGTIIADALVLFNSVTQYRTYVVEGSNDGFATSTVLFDNRSTPDPYTFHPELPGANGVCASPQFSAKSTRVEFSSQSNHSTIRLSIYSQYAAAVVGVYITEIVPLRKY